MLHTTGSNIRPQFPVNRNLPLLSREIQGEFDMNTILKTLGDLLATMVRGANTKEFEEYDGSFEKLKTDKNSAEFNRNVSGWLT